jgi:hypothetical protein
MLHKKTCKHKFVKYSNTKSKDTINGIQGTKQRWIYRKRLKYDNFESLIPDGFIHKTTECIPNGLEFDDWISQSTILTIKDIYKMKKGDSIDVAVIDRNVLDTDRIKRLTLYSPIIFFKHAKGKYIHNHGLTGKLILKDTTIDPFEFHVKLPMAWYPLKNGILPSHDNQDVFELYNKPIKWQDMPTTLPIGFRGPMIPWSKLSKRPLYYLE